MSESCAVATVRVPVDVDDATRRSLKVVAARAGISVRTVIARCLIDILQDGGETPSAELRRLARIA